jgi:hypothetical protein
MKKLLLFILVILTVSTLSAQQVSLYDSDGEARAYIDYDEDATIFMWDGTPVAFVEKDGSDLCVFGFNRSFLGWYEDGIIYDKKGYAVGARKGAVSMITKIERIKGIQKITPIRPITPITPIQPILKSSWSNTSLTEFLYFGKK